jgi:hypothetical protein
MINCIRCALVVVSKATCSNILVIKCMVCIGGGDQGNLFKPHQGKLLWKSCQSILRVNACKL